MSPVHYPCYNDRSMPHNDSTDDSDFARLRAEHSRIVSNMIATGVCPICLGVIIGTICLGCGFTPETVPPEAP